MDHSDVEWNVNVREICMPITEVFKCVGGEQGLAAYVKDIFKDSQNQSDWSGLYLQFDLPHALGTVGYRWDQGYSIAQVVKAELRDITVCIVDALWMADGTVSGETKSNTLRKALRLESNDHSANTPLLEALALQRKALVCRETESQWELAIGPSLAQSIEFQGHATVMELRPGAFGGTKSYRTDPTSTWKSFDDLNLPQPQPPEWITSALS